MDVELIIDDVQVTAPAGASVLDAARRAGRDIPALCHHEAVPAIASCRLCLMEVRRPGRDWVQLTTSCDYPVSAGLVVVTDSPRIRKHRAMNLQLLLRRAPDAPVLRRLAAQLDVAEPLFAPVTDAPLPDCILCELCVRVCSTLGYNALAAIGRGAHKQRGSALRPDGRRGLRGLRLLRRGLPHRRASRWRTRPPRARSGAAPSSSSRASAAAGRSRPKRTPRRWPPRSDLPEKSDGLCDVCKRRAASERLASPGH